MHLRYAELLLGVTSWLVVGVVDGFLPNSPAEFLSALKLEGSCGNTDYKENWDHRRITEEGIRQAVLQYFQDNVLEGNVFELDENSDLTEIYKGYYGQTINPRNFLATVEELLTASADVDLSDRTANLAWFHFDSEKIKETHEFLVQRFRQVVTTINGLSADFGKVREHFGASLNILQDFYSHTSWVELGNTECDHELGLPGGQLGMEVADPGDVTCKDCDSEDGECQHNIEESLYKLTSGYRVGKDADGNEINKPENRGKCSHGGVLDSTRTQKATGGINKDSIQACLSPHWYLHKHAADLAVMATARYFGALRDAIGDENFARFLSLHPTSALSLVVDSTGSMANEVEGVKQGVKWLLKSKNPTVYQQSPLYVMVRVVDTDVVLTKTTSASEFLTALESVTTASGGDGKEPVFEAIKMAAIETPANSDIYVFTDSVSKDELLVDEVVSLLKTKKLRIHFIWSGRQMSDQEGENVGKTSTYQSLAHVTGGDFITLSSMSSHVEKVKSLLNETTGQAKVTLAMRRGMARGGVPQKIDIPVDSTITSLQVTIVGATLRAKLVNPNNESMDVVEFSEDSDRYEVINEKHLVSMKIRPKMAGKWFLMVEIHAGGTYSITVQGETTADFIPAVTLPKWNVLHPGLKTIKGNPHTGARPWLQVRLTDARKIHLVDKVAFVDAEGATVATTAVTPEHGKSVQTVLYIPDVELPGTPAYLQISGKDTQGYQFVRMSNIQTEVANAEVEFVSPVMSAEPGGATNLQFSVKNYGDLSTFIVRATDAHKHLHHEDERVSLDKNETKTIDSVMEIPAHMPTHHSSIDTVIFTAKAESDMSVSSEIVQFFINSPADDDKPPSCAVDVSGSCSLLEGESCASVKWNYTATVKDQHGLQKIHSRPGTGKYSNNFVYGTQDNVTYQGTPDCCHMKVTIIAVDMNGNFMKCYASPGDVLRDSTRSGLTSTQITLIAICLVLLIIILAVIAVIAFKKKRGYRSVSKNPPKDSEAADMKNMSDD